MRIMAVVFFSSSTFGAWVFNYPAIASPSPEIFQNQDTSANSKAIELPEAGGYSEVTRVPNVEETRTLETQVDRGKVKMPVLKLTDLTPVSGTAAELLPVEHLQAQNPVPEGKPEAGVYSEGTRVPNIEATRVLETQVDRGEVKMPVLKLTDLTPVFGTAAELLPVEHLQAQSPVPEGKPEAGVYSEGTRVPNIEATRVLETQVDRGEVKMPVLKPTDLTPVSGTAAELLPVEHLQAQSPVPEGKPEAGVYSEGTRVPNIDATRVLETQVDRGEVKMPVLKLTDLTPVSGTPADLLPLEGLQAQSPVPEKNPDFPEVPPQ